MGRAHAHPDPSVCGTTPHATKICAHVQSSTSAPTYLPMERPMRSMAHAIVQAVEVRGRPGHLHVPQYSVQSALSAPLSPPAPNTAARQRAEVPRDTLRAFRFGLRACRSGRASWRPPAPAARARRGCRPNTSWPPRRLRRPEGGTGASSESVPSSSPP